MVIEEKPRVSIEFELETIRDQNSVCTSSYGRYLPTHSHSTLTYQNKPVQPLISKPLLSYTIHIEKSNFYNYPRQYLTKKVFY